MKLLNRLIFLALTTFFLISPTVYGQVEEKVKNRTKYKTNQKIDQTVDKTIDKGFNKIGGLFKKKDKKKKDQNEEVEESQTSTTNTPGSAKDGMNNAEEIEIWSVRYDFKPGKTIIFYDDFESEEVGEIPSKWKYVKGELETVQADEKQVLRWTGYTRPNFAKEVALPDEFTIEFDVFLKGPPYNGSYNYNVDFLVEGNRSTNFKIGVGMGHLFIRGLQEGFIPDTKQVDFHNQWHHVSISYNKGSLKAYFNEHRLLNIRTDHVPFGIQFDNCCTTRDNDHIFMIDNVRIAEGAHPKYKEEVIKGKIVTHDILFETDSDQIILRSYAAIKRIADLMQDDSSLKFSVEGHTDSDGEEGYNQDLSKRRAEAVKNALIDMGIDKDRLTSKGFGESQPIESNDTPEGKAMNRRVEFVKSE